MLATNILESAIQKQIIKFLVSNGAFLINIHGSVYHKGVPDLIVSYKGRFIGLEVKKPGGKATPLQLEKLRAIRKSGSIGEVVYGNGKVKRILETIDSGEQWEDQPFE